MNYPYRPTDMIGADKDLVLAIHHLKSTLTTTINCQHIYGHQDRDSGKTSTKQQGDSAAAHNTPPDSTDRVSATLPTLPRAGHGPSLCPQQESSLTRDDTKNNGYNEIRETLRQGTRAQQQHKQQKEDAAKKKHGRELNALPTPDTPKPVDNIMRELLHGTQKPREKGK